MFIAFPFIYIAMLDIHKSIYTQVANDSQKYFEFLCPGSQISDSAFILQARG